MSVYMSLCFSALFLFVAMSVCTCLCVYMCLCVSLYVSLFLCVWVYVSVFLCVVPLCGYECLYVSVCVFVCLCFCVFVCRYECLCMCLCLYMSLYVSLFLYISVSMLVYVCLYMPYMCLCAFVYLPLSAYSLAAFLTSQSFLILNSFFCICFLQQFLAGKTKDIITNLKSLAGEQEEGDEAKITIETIKSRNFSTSMQNFLFNLALAENLVQS